jgi:ppGpp synthetase/RelA/SpoT-type nucleotidyltranferase
MDVIDQFLARYRKEYDFYDQAARLAAQIVEQSLQSAGIRAIVTSRAKSLVRLEEKVRKREAKYHYQTVDDLFKDIVDLAGVRIALYFPADREQVDKIVTQRFVLAAEPRMFPESVEKRNDSKPAANYKKRFSGYSATHYRVHLHDVALNEAQKRYGQALVEIQVASVLMHAWAEVEHDLVYKPQQGTLSEDEYAILDAINGLVISGEIALEQLQRAAKKRIAEKGRKFSSHYDLADYLLDQASALLTSSDPDQSLGRVIVLYKLLLQIDKATPDAVSPYIAALSADFERRSLSDQIIDQLLAEDPKRYDMYENLKGPELGEPRTLAPQSHQDAAESQASMGRFLEQWIRFEREVRRATDKEQRPKPWLVPTTKLIAELGLIDQRLIPEVDRIRRFRNNLVHGVEIPPTADIDNATEILKSIVADLIPKKPRGKR